MSWRLGAGGWMVVVAIVTAACSDFADYRYGERDASAGAGGSVAATGGTSAAGSGSGGAGGAVGGTGGTAGDAGTGGTGATGTGGISGAGGTGAGGTGGVSGTAGDAGASGAGGSGGVGGTAGQAGSGGVGGGSGGTSGSGGSGGCGSGLKQCGGLCVTPSPGVGCSLSDCTACPAVTNGTAKCSGTACDFDCPVGTTKSGGSCAACGAVGGQCQVMASSPGLCGALAGGGACTPKGMFGINGCPSPEGCHLSLQGPICSAANPTQSNANCTGNQDCFHWEQCYCGHCRAICRLDGTGGLSGACNGSSCLDVGVTTFGVCDK